MNYIKDNSKFAALMCEKELSGNATKLWVWLFELDNRSHWENTFTATKAELIGALSLTEAKFRAARKELINKGFLKFKSQNKKAGIYELIPPTSMDNDTKSTKAQTRKEPKGKLDIFEETKRKIERWK